MGPLKNLNNYLLGIQLTRDTNEILSRIEKENYEMANKLKGLITNIPLYDSNFIKFN